MFCLELNWQRISSLFLFCFFGFLFCNFGKGTLTQVSACKMQNEDFSLFYQFYIIFEKILSKPTQMITKIHNFFLYVISQEVLISFTSFLKFKIISNFSNRACYSPLIFNFCIVRKTFIK